MEVKLRAALQVNITVSKFSDGNLHKNINLMTINALIATRLYWVIITHDIYDYRISSTLIPSIFSSRSQSVFFKLCAIRSMSWFVTEGWTGNDRTCSLAHSVLVRSSFLFDNASLS
jgi:hypothetical protein